MITTDEVLDNLRALADPRNVEGMARYGIRPAHPLGISMATLRRLAKPLAPDHGLALGLWASGIHEARLLATIIDDPKAVTAEQADAWVGDLDSWDICDQCCINLFRRTPFAWDKAVEWAGRPEEYVRRAGFSLMAVLAVHDKKAADERFVALLPAIRNGGSDERNAVKKSVSWALRQIGKRNPTLREAALTTAAALRTDGSRSARWIASDTQRELSRRP